MIDAGMVWNPVDGLHTARVASSGAGPYQRPHADGVRSTWREMLASLRRAYIVNSYPRVDQQTLHDVDVQVVGDVVAVLTALVVDEVHRDGVSETFRMRLTQTWVNTANGWQCLSGHAGPRLG
jgi:uncharacterized protein DUF4440